MAGKRVFHSVVFDWNGTLVNDARFYYMRVLVPILEEFGIDLAAYKSSAGYDRLRYQYSMLGPEKFIDMVAAQHNKDLSWQEAVLPLVVSNYSKESPRLMPHAENVVSVLHDKMHIPIGAVSGMRHDLFITALKEKGLYDYFMLRRGSISHKTATFRAFLDLVNCRDEPQRVLLVSDINKDLQEAEKAGLTAVGIDRGYGDAESLEEAEPFAIISNLPEIFRLGEFRPRRFE